MTVRNLTSDQIQRDFKCNPFKEGFMECYYQITREASLDHILTVVSLTPNDPLDTFVEMWYQIFLWALFSSMFVHIIAALVALCRLRRHSIGRWYAMLILVMGVVGPCTGGVLTSAVIAWCFSKSSTDMPAIFALLAGFIQTIICIIISFTKIPATL